MGGWWVVGLVGKSDFKDSPKSELDLGLGFVNKLFILLVPKKM